MVDRVAQALMLKLRGGYHINPSDDPIVWGDYRATARAAIAAMREPTQEMLADENIHWSDSGCIMCGGLKEGWELMFKAALR